MLQNRKVIVDEDILRALFATQSVSNSDIRSAVNSGRFTGFIENKLSRVLASDGYQHYDYSDISSVTITEDILDALEKTSGNIIELAKASYVYKGKDSTVYLKRRWLPCDKVIIMSATAEKEIYEMLMNDSIYYYSCKTAAYIGKLKVYSNYSFSRYSINENTEVMKYVKSEIGDDAVITFLDLEEELNTKYHYGAIEGLNCLEGKDISVVGLPNLAEEVYKLYGMAAGVDVVKYSMRSMRVEYNGCSFEVQTYDQPMLRKIHLWFLMSQIEQAVGRARLLRNSCTVKVFARFPVDQGEFSVT